MMDNEIPKSESLSQPEKTCRLKKTPIPVASNPCRTSRYQSGL